LFLTTALFNQLVRQAPECFKGLRYLLFGGERVDVNAVRLAVENGKPANLLHVYGPTETTTFATYHRIESIGPEEETVPIGRPISNTQVYLLDDSLEPVPLLTGGEIYIGGPGLALGYLNDPERTADRFRETPLGRLYKTGDLARWRNKGALEFIGRKDRQIKLRGFRIEPGEVEAAVRELPGVADCVTLLNNGSGVEPRLVSYFVAAGEVASANVMREALTRSLPEYMLPDVLVRVERFPLTANGKIDTRALPKPPASSTTVSTTEPDGPYALHTQLVDIWEELLGRRPIGVNDDFFSLGGHSLLAARMIAEIETRLGQRLPLSAIWEEATIAHLAKKLLEMRLRAAEQSPVVVIQSGGSRLPLFFLHGDFSGGGFYCRNLARYIGADRPFYAIHPHGLHGEQPPRTIEAMAASRLKEVRRIQPHGPYLLGGFCNGANVAFEMGRELRKQGEAVLAVVMLAADGSNFRFRHVQRLSRLISALRGEGEDAVAARFLRWRQRTIDIEARLRSWVERLRMFTERSLRQQARGIARRARRVLKQLSQSNMNGAFASPNVPQNVESAYFDAQRAYVPGRFDGTIVLLWPEEDAVQPGCYPTYGWADVCPDTRLILVAGEHHSSIAVDRHLRTLGEQVRLVLDECEASCCSVAMGGPIRTA
jgi:thioesterase domain-containing protein/acyl carrier protein